MSFIIWKRINSLFWIVWSHSDDLDEQKIFNSSQNGRLCYALDLGLDVDHANLNLRSRMTATVSWVFNTYIYSQIVFYTRNMFIFFTPALIILSVYLQDKNSLCRDQKFTVELPVSYIEFLTPIITFAVEVQFQIRDRFWIPQSTLHGWMYLFFCKT